MGLPGRLSRGSLVAVATVILFSSSASYLAAQTPTKKFVAIIAGYPAPDAPMFEFGFRKLGAKAD